MLEQIRKQTEPLYCVPGEGDLFKIIHCFGQVFEIRYGYYEESDRHHPYAEPMEIYPDFIKQPQYTEEGIPFVTAIQNPCPHFMGKRDENTTCEECFFYRHCEELLGVCVCPENKEGGTHKKKERATPHSGEKRNHPKNSNHPTR